jgi:hypothetical protein
LPIIVGRPFNYISGDLKGDAMKSAKTIFIVAAVLFAALSLSAPSAQRDEAAPARVTAPRASALPAPVLEEAPAPRPAVRPVRTTTTRTPSPRTPTRPDIVRRITPEDPHKNSVILLEAFMVEVPLSALHSLGLPAISQNDDIVTARHIIKLMKTTDAAAITAGAKLALAQANKARTGSTTRKGLYMDPPNNTKTEYIDVGTSFTAIAEIRKEKVFAELEFEYSDAVKDDEKAHAMPQIVERNWGSTVCLSPGEPAIVGAIQDKDSATFLIVTANIKQ